MRSETEIKQLIRTLEYVRDTSLQYQEFDVAIKQLKRVLENEENGET